MGPQPAPLLQLERLTKQFPGVLALNQVSLSIAAGEIHAVIGENGAGKSTLINILTGSLRPDSGRILFKGQPQEIRSPMAARHLGIGVVHQELALCPNLSAAENISLHSVASTFALQPVDRRAFRRQARTVLERLGIGHLDMDRPVGQLSVALQQLVEIARAILLHSEVLILDEPNSALTHEETEHLFSVLRQMRAEGVAIVYVSHRLDEVLSLADRITVLRDGQYVDTLPAATATVPRLIENMVGRVVDGLYARQAELRPREEMALEIRGLTSGSAVRGVSFQIRVGEIVGVAGLPDSGKDELVSCLFGLRPVAQGAIWVGAQPVKIGSPRTAIRHGLVLIPADRRGDGAFLTLPIQDNVAAASLGTLSKLGVLLGDRLRNLGDRSMRDLDIRAHGLSQPMATLSGGNQQKVVLARGLATGPSVLLLHEPTRGIDVGAKAEIYSILYGLVRDGAAALIVSSELPELLGQCDRILVMHAGRVTGHFTRGEANEEAILACAMGHATHL